MEANVLIHNLKNELIKNEIASEVVAPIPRRQLSPAENLDLGTLITFNLIEIPPGLEEVLARMFFCLEYGDLELYAELKSLAVEKIMMNKKSGSKIRF